MQTKDFPSMQQAREVVQKQAEVYKTYYSVGVIADSFFPVYTYRYDEHTNILTQYKNGVEYQRMFVPETYSLKEIL